MNGRTRWVALSTAVDGTPTEIEPALVDRPHYVSPDRRTAGHCVAMGPVRLRSSGTNNASQVASVLQLRK